MDDMVVGGGGASTGKNLFAAEDDDRYPVERNYEPDEPSVPKSIHGGGGRAAKQSRGDDNDYHSTGPKGISSLPEEVLPNGDRPIRPKAEENYLDMDPDVPSEYPEPAGNAESFGAGEHPLEGVPNFHELPAPEQLQGKYR